MTGLSWVIDGGDLDARCSIFFFFFSVRWKSISFFLPHEMLL